jgi:hypothetical protein
MATFFNPDNVGDNRLHAPATARNKDILKEVFIKYMPPKGTLIEIASGTGEHAYHIAPSLKPLCWQPTDIEGKHLASIDAWRNYAMSEAQDNNTNILPAISLDILEGIKKKPNNDRISAICAINLIHIAPIEVAKALVVQAEKNLSHNGILFLYGPYKHGGEHTSKSNADFDQSLRSRNPEWGIRDLEFVTELALNHNFQEPEILAMPANNFSLIFKKL